MECGNVSFASDVYAAARVIGAVCVNGVIDDLNLRNLLNRMLSVNAQDRPRASEALLEVQRLGWKAEVSVDKENKSQCEVQRTSLASSYI